jgi:23S rRNA (cytosine1962-C5)-methyltransferase
MSELPRIVLKPKHAQPFYARHPWVFAGSISEVVGNPSDGAEVDLVNHLGAFVARGLFNSQSKIRVRLYSWDESSRLDREFWRTRIRSAIHLRHHVLNLDRSMAAAYRVVFGEADFLSGLVVDRYADYLAVQFTSLAMGLRREEILELLVEELNPRGIVIRTEKGISRMEGLDLSDGWAWGAAPDGDLVIEEYGLKFVINLSEGQKTGYYLDQRDNRATVARLCPGKRVLDAFCYSGGFGIRAAKAGAERVMCVDASDGAIDLAFQNAMINAVSNIDFIAADVFEQMADLVEEKQTFEVVILDPPKFARDKRSVPDAIRGYRRLHQLAMKLLTPDGVLVSCCCSGLVPIEDFEDVIAQCAVQARRNLQILERRGPSPDHPVAIACRESSYLKCIISRVC